MTSLNGSEEASDSSFQTYDDRRLNETEETPKRTLPNLSMINQLAWYRMPELSLSELAFRLKQAEIRVFGKDKYLLSSTNANTNISSNDNNNVVSSKDTDTRNNHKNEHDNEDGFTEDDVSVNSDLLNRNVYSEVYNSFDTSAQRTLMAINEKYKKLEDKYSGPLPFEGSFMHPEFSKIKEEPMDTSMDSLPGIIKKFGCGWCSYKTDSKAHLMRHSKSMHKNVEMKIVLNPTYIPPSKQPKDLKRKHQCEMCSYQTDCKSHLRRHQGSVHCKDKLYECPTCKIEFARSEQAKIHHMAYHPEKHFDIRNMHKPASNAKQLKLSVNDKMEKIKTLFGEVEHFTDNLHQPSNNEMFDNSTNEKDLDGSSDQGNSDNLSPQKKKIRLRVNNAFVCLKCNYSCRDMWHLKRHVLDVHSTLKDFNCKVCHYATSRAHRLYCHMLKHGELFCHLCEFSTVNPEIYKLHSQTCTAAQKSLNCSICSVDFERMGVYKDHISSHHPGAMLECTKCSFITTSDPDLASHMPSHNWESRACKLCWHLAVDEKTLVEHFSDFHAKFNADNNVWICSECNEQNSDKNELSNHIETHICSVLTCPMELCQFKCTLQSSVNMHLKYMHRDNDDDDFIEHEKQEEEDVDKNEAAKFEGEDENVIVNNKSLKNLFKSNDDVYPDFKPPLDEGSTLPSMIATTNNSNTESNAFLKETFQGYLCSLCPDRPPFRYKKSFDKHVSQHAMEDLVASDAKNNEESFNISS